MLKQSKQMIFVTNASKFGNLSSASICLVSEIHTILCSTRVSPEALAPFERQGINVIRA
jgi:DeoR/GlpR family transcriptional regulator of sugar metabolism